MAERHSDTLAVALDSGESDALGDPDSCDDEDDDALCDALLQGEDERHRDTEGVALACGDADA